MNREYTVDQFLEICRIVKKEFPGLCLWTDIIVGFPTETDEQFQDTVELIKNVQPDKVNVTRYSPRPHTKAAKMPQFPDRIKKERSRALYRLRMDISLKINTQYIGAPFEVLINDYGLVESTMMGRTFNYKPVVCTGALGEFKTVTIKSCKPTYLKAL
jgi:tRNA A37 methylthiotransferase MiaB